MDFFPLVKIIYDRIPNITAGEIKDMQRAFAKEKKMKDLPSKSQILNSYFKAVKEWKLERNQTFETLLRKRAIRSLSWIVPVQVLTKPWPCPGQCIFCPNDPWMPKSYIKSEPGAMRAWLNQFDPMKQTYNRLQSLTTTGHQTDKIEMIILWWSWDAYPRDYKIDFVKQLYDACNTFSELKIVQGESFWTSDSEVKNLMWNVQDSSANASEWQYSKYHFEIENLDKIKYSDSLEEAIKRNETAKNRIIWLTIETRPDLVNHENCKFWRELWVTRVEMWIQSTNDEVLKLNKRGHDVQKIKDAMYIMRQYWLKISIHLMPWLYGSDFEKDIQSFRDIYTDPAFQPDEIKFYPTSVIPNTELYNLYKEWKYTPITTEQILSEIRETFLNIIPPYTRIKRLIRDIPATEIVAWSNITNLSQMAHESLLKEMRDSYNWKWSIDVENFYKRLYGDYKLYESEDEYFQKKSPFGKGEAPKEQGDIYKKNFLAYNPSLLEKAKELRKNMTKAEKKLRYECLQSLEVKVLRRQPIDEYIVDFYVASKKLVIEIDWDTHWSDKEIEYDEKRTEILNNLWLKIIRFTNNEVLNNFESVCGEINEILYPPYPPCQRGAENVSPLFFPADGGQYTEIIWTQPDLKSFRNFVCLDTRSREVRNRVEKKKSDDLNLVLRWYKSSAGQECFISFEDELGYLYGFTRLLLPNDDCMVWIQWLEKWTAIIRELHVYGELQKIWDKSGKWTQHTWLGRRLLAFAEGLSKDFWYNQFSVISWVGVREYYRSLWFELKGTYMAKKI